MAVAKTEKQGNKYTMQYNNTNTYMFKHNYRHCIYSKSLITLYALFTNKITQNIGQQDSLQKANIQCNVTVTVV